MASTNSSTKLITDAFPKTKKDRPINQKLQLSKAKRVSQNVPFSGRCLRKSCKQEMGMFISDLLSSMQFSAYFMQQELQMIPVNETLFPFLNYLQDPELLVTDKKAEELSVLKEFDLDSEYGPCIGITRLERWERAEEYGLYPPREVKSIILQHPNDTKFTECVWYDANL